MDIVNTSLFRQITDRMELENTIRNTAEDLNKLFDVAFLGCGNLGGAILSALVKKSKIDIDFFIACVNSPESEQKLQQQYQGNPKVEVVRGDNVSAVQNSRIVILAVPPSEVESVLRQPGMLEALHGGKLLLSVVAGWTREALASTLYGSLKSYNANPDFDKKPFIVRALPNVGASVGQSMTAVELGRQPPASTSWDSMLWDKMERILEAIGVRVSPDALPFIVQKRTFGLSFSYLPLLQPIIHVNQDQIDLATAVAGSTPAFWGILADAFVDASVAVGMPRDMARAMIAQSMLGSATILRNGTTPSELRDQGTSPEGCTMAGTMVLEEAGVRGAVGKALREAVTVARRMGKEEHLNDTRH
jgi:pyrroline-5-carboxylate reductase